MRIGTKVVATTNIDDPVSRVFVSEGSVGTIAHIYYGPTGPSKYLVSFPHGRVAVSAQRPPIASKESLRIAKTASAIIEITAEEIDETPSTGEYEAGEKEGKKAAKDALSDILPHEDAGFVAAEVWHVWSQFDNKVQYSDQFRLGFMDGFRETVNSSPQRKKAQDTRPAEVKGVEKQSAEEIVERNRGTKESQTQQQPMKQNKPLKKNIAPSTAPSSPDAPKAEDAEEEEDEILDKEKQSYSHVLFSAIWKTPYDKAEVLGEQVADAIFAEGDFPDIDPIGLAEDMYYRLNINKLAPKGKEDADEFYKGFTEGYEKKLFKLRQGTPEEHLMEIYEEGGEGDEKAAQEVAPEDKKKKQPRKRKPVDLSEIPDTLSYFLKDKIPVMEEQYKTPEDLVALLQEGTDIAVGSDHMTPFYQKKVMFTAGELAKIPDEGFALKKYIHNLYLKGAGMGVISQKKRRKEETKPKKDLGEVPGTLSNLLAGVMGTLDSLDVPEMLDMLESKVEEAGSYVSSVKAREIMETAKRSAVRGKPALMSYITNLMLKGMGEGVVDVTSEKVAIKYSTGDYIQFPKGTLVTMNSGVDMGKKVPIEQGTTMELKKRHQGKEWVALTPWMGLEVIVNVTDGERVLSAAETKGVTASSRLRKIAALISGQVIPRLPSPTEIQKELDAAPDIWQGAQKFVKKYMRGGKKLVQEIINRAKTDVMFPKQYVEKLEQASAAVFEGGLGDVDIKKEDKPAPWTVEVERKDPSGVKEFEVKDSSLRAARKERLSKLSLHDARKKRMRKRKKNPGYY